MTQYTRAERNNEIEKKLFIAFVGCILLTCALYVYFVVHASVFASEHTRVTLEVNKLRSQVGDLEATYIAKNKNINRQYARDLGFSDAEKIAFATQPILVSNVRGTGNEI